MSFLNFQHQRAHDLTAQEDPEEEPYRSKYAARVLLEQVRVELSAELDRLEAAGIAAAPAAATPSSESTINTAAAAASTCAALGAVELLLGNNHATTEELSAGEALLLRATEHLRRAPLEAVACELVDAHNSLGILWSQRGEHAKSQLYIQLAIDTYADATATATAPSAASSAASSLSALAISSPSLSPSPSAAGPRITDPARRAKLESLHTHSLFYMAQACQHLGQVQRAVRLCEQTLDRQLRAGAFDPSDGAKNCIFLSTYYLAKRNFRQVEHCLAAADKLLSMLPRAQKSEDTLSSSSSSSSSSAASLEHEARMRADLSRSRAAFHLQWLKLSVARLISSGGGENDDDGSAANAADADADADANADGDASSSATSLFQARWAIMASSIVKYFNQHAISLLTINYARVKRLRYHFLFVMKNVKKYSSQSLDFFDARLHDCHPLSSRRCVCRRRPRARSPPTMSRRARFFSARSRTCSARSSTMCWTDTSATTLRCCRTRVPPTRHSRASNATPIAASKC